MKGCSTLKDTNNKIISINEFKENREGKELISPTSIHKRTYDNVDSKEVARRMQMGYMRMLSNQNNK